MGAMAFLCLQRAEERFFQSFVTFNCLLANDPRAFPTVCSALVSAGLLTPLNKESAIERKRRKDLHLPPKLRPINSGSLISKTVLKAILSTPAAERQRERVRSSCR